MSDTDYPPMGDPTDIDELLDHIHWMEGWLYERKEFEKRLEQPKEVKPVQSSCYT